jgi:hypothetical protein
MLRDDEMFPISVRIHGEDSDGIGESDRMQGGHTNDTFDDVFGSAPPSPTFHDDDDTDNIQHSSGGNMEYSDIPRLREKHETEGYRDGVTKGKGETVQAGFDEGYGLGAVLGLKAGRILGLLEGLWSAVSTAAKKEEGETWTAESERLRVLLQDGRVELKTESLFGREWWGEDGIWTYPVQDEVDVVFTDVAAAHPLMVKWEAIIETEVQKWGLDLSIMENDPTGGETRGKETSNALETPPRNTGGIQKKELIW